MQTQGCFYERIFTNCGILIETSARCHLMEEPIKRVSQTSDLRFTNERVTSISDLITQSNNMQNAR